MTWEYLVINTRDVYSCTEETAMLNQYGDQGWCLVSVDRGIVYFRRPIMPAPDNPIDNVF
jgi:hypothetical protein